MVDTPTEEKSGFVSIPFWTVITGGVMTHYGFGPAFTLILTSYLLAIEPAGFSAHAPRSRRTT